MEKVCINCGKFVEDNYKFCPCCGTSISDNNIVICSNCGNENTHNESFCTECGLKLNSDNVKREKRDDKEYVKKNQNEKKKKTVERTSHQKIKKRVEKSLSKGKLYTILVGVLGLILILLISVGVFDQTVTATNNVPPPSNPQVNLANLQKINELAAQVNANPNNMELLLELAHLRNDSGFFQKAINNYHTYLEKKPNNVDARIDMGVCYYNLNNFTKAIEEMERAIKIKPNHQIGLLNLGVVNLTAGNLDKSKEWLNKAINVDPNSQIAKRAQELLNAHQTN